MSDIEDNGSCWDEAPFGPGQSNGLLCELKAGHQGAHCAGATEWMPRGGVSFDGAWSAWCPALTDLSNPTPSYYDAFRAGWNSASQNSYSGFSEGGIDWSTHIEDPVTGLVSPAPEAVPPNACQTCSGTVRRTVGMVCPRCGENFAPLVEEPPRPSRVRWEDALKANPSMGDLSSERGRSTVDDAPEGQAVHDG